MGSFKKFLLENPDRIGNNKFFWKSNDARCFGFINNKFFISDKPIIHSDLIISLINSGKISVSDLSKNAQKTMEVSRDDFQSPGRVWISEKVISFWNKIDKSQLNHIMKELNKKGILIDETWKIESEEGKMIPIKDFESKKDFAYADHIKSPMDKTKDFDKIPKQSKLKLAPGMFKAKYNSLRNTSESLDHGQLNMPLSKRGNIDNQIDKYLKDKKTQEKEEHKKLKTQFDIDKKIASELFDKNSESLIKRGVEVTGKSKSQVLKSYQNIIKTNPSSLRKSLEKEFGKLEENVPTSVAPVSDETGIHASKLGEVGKRNEGKFKKFIKKKKKNSDELKEDNNTQQHYSGMANAKMLGLKHVSFNTYMNPKDGQHCVWDNIQKKFHKVGENINNSSDYDEKIKRYEKYLSLEDDLKKAKEILNKFPKGQMGITLDSVKNSNEWKTAKRNVDVAFNNLRNFNSNKNK